MAPPKEVRGSMLRSLPCTLLPTYLALAVPPTDTHIHILLFFRRAPLATRLFRQDFAVLTVVVHDIGVYTVCICFCAHAFVANVHHCKPIYDYQSCAAYSTLVAQQRCSGSPCLVWQFAAVDGPPSSDRTLNCGSFVADRKHTTALWPVTPTRRSSFKLSRRFSHPWPLSLRRSQSMQQCWSASLSQRGRLPSEYHGSMTRVPCTSTEVTESRPTLP